MEKNPQTRRKIRVEQLRRLWGRQCLADVQRRLLIQYQAGTIDLPEVTRRVQEVLHQIHNQAGTRYNLWRALEIFLLPEEEK